MYRKLTKPLDGRSSNVKAFFQPQPVFSMPNLQLMDEIPIRYPWLHNLFQPGYYGIRRSD